MKVPATKSTSLKRLPYMFAIIGIACTLLLWYSLLSISLPIPFIKAALPWVALSAGLSMVILCATIIYLIQLKKERTFTRSFIANEAKKELAERLKSEAVKQKLEIALLQGQKLQAIGTLAGGIAHDFNNILYAIKGFVEMAMEDVEKNTLAYNNLGRVLEAAQRAQELVKRILTFGRQQQQFDAAPIPIQPVIEGILELLKPTIPASINIHLIGTKDDLLISGNQTQLHQVIVNIVINAVDAMEGEGTVTIKLSRLAKSDPYLKQFPEMHPSNYCKIEITDTGHGMDQHTMERIFEPFYTTKETGKGTGLGLAMVHSIIQQHEGKITVSSQLGRGTLFTILLPEQQCITPQRTPSEATHRE